MMKKFMATAVLSATMLAAASPAFAHTTVVGDDNLSASFYDASQAQSAVAVQTGDANVAADDFSIADAGNSLGVYQYQYSAGF